MWDHLSKQTELDGYSVDVSQTSLNTLALVYSRTKFDPVYLIGYLIISMSLRDLERLLLLLALRFFSRWRGQFYKVFAEITRNSGEDKIKADEIHTSIVFGILIKYCKIETHFLFETEQNWTSRCSNIKICTERETANKSGMRNFKSVC